MKYYNFIKTKEVPINKRAMPEVSHPTEIAFDDLYEDLNKDWEEKAIRLQVRRWRKIKHQLV
jgi:hypothetical protein